MTSQTRFCFDYKLCILARILYIEYVNPRMRQQDIFTGVSGNSVLCDTDTFKKIASI